MAPRLFNHFSKHAMSNLQIIKKDHKMNIHEYIQLFTNLENDSRRDKVKLSNTLVPNEYLRLGHSYNSSLPAVFHQMNLNNAVQTKLDDLGSYIISIFKKYFKVFQQKHVGMTAEISSNKSDVTYVTATSVTEKSYLTTVEDFKECDEGMLQLEKSNYELESEIPFDNGIDEGKRELIVRLLKSKASNFGSEENISPDSPSDPCSAQNLFEIEIDQKVWNDDVISDRSMYTDRLLRFFQTTEDPDSIPTQKISPIRENSRQYFMNLPDEHFSKFEKRESLRSFKVNEQ